MQHLCVKQQLSRTFYLEYNVIEDLIIYYKIKDIFPYTNCKIHKNRFDETNVISVLKFQFTAKSIDFVLLYRYYKIEPSH